MENSASRRCFGRQDLDELKQFDRAAVFTALGSFDETGLSDREFAPRVAALLDPKRVPGLEEALDSGAADAIAEAAYRACLERGETRSPALADNPGHAQEAEEVMAHCFTFYGETYTLPADIDWDFNLGTGHWGHDLNRFSFLAPLSRACLQTGAERFGRKAVELILDWIARCDFSCAFTGTPYVFGSYLNQAIHCEAWCHCLRRLLPVGAVAPIEMLRVLKSLHDQLAYLEIVTRGHSGNWPTIGCRGMLAVLAAFPFFRDTERFARHCREGLAAQIDAQILPDGVQDELTPHYHWVVVNNLLSASRSLSALGMTLEERTLETLRRMVHYTQQTIVPDSSAQVAFNDSDPAAVPALASALEQAGLEDFLRPPEQLGPEHFPCAGVAFLRQRADQGDLYLAFDGGPYGRSHQHEDKLGLWLFAHGRSFLVDPGRHLYDSSAASYREYLCSTRAHSTALIDGAGQHSRGRPDTWITRQPGGLTWKTVDGEFRAASAYDLGYGEDNAIAVTHQREIAFVRERLWVIFDYFEGEGEHTVELRFQFAPGQLQQDGNRAWTLFPDANLLLWSEPSAPYVEGRVEEGQEDPRGGWYSARYGQLETAPCLSFTAQATLPFCATTLLFPYRKTLPTDLSFSLVGHTAVVQSGDTGEVRVDSSQ